MEDDLKKKWKTTSKKKWKTTSIVSMGGQAEGLAYADPGERIPIGASGNFEINIP